ncbi:23S rRNA (adenine(2503)-C(2))-methyltransferase RlmN [Patescibacteria group bacterium]|nr:23S rRNA (adenine(2503)-C(2))-methyltransferase RlmN [Patescibacteria group bacterium]
MDIKKVEKLLSELNLPNFRLKQIVKNYFSGKYKKFEEMTDLPLDLRKELDDKVGLLAVAEIEIKKGEDCEKTVLKLKDGKKIETVLMNYGEWISACLSTQVGCAMGCKFCATGKMGLKRNLEAEEIVDQLLYWNNKVQPQYVGRIVFMGMGEPFANWENVWRAIEIIHDNLDIGWRKMSISTVGIIEKIYEFADLGVEINLAVSLHATDQKTREKLMPVAKENNLDELRKAFEYYCQKTRRQLFFEYALIDGINDSIAEARRLSRFIKSNKLFYLNIIKLNPTDGAFWSSNREREADFLRELDRARVLYSVRKSFGREIKAACGQLVVRYKDE